MKSSIRIISLVLLAGILSILSSCEKEELPDITTGKLELAVIVPESQLKSVDPDSTDGRFYHVMLTVINSLGETVLEDEMIPLYRFGNDFVSERVEMKPGRYQLTGFMIINPAGQVVYAAPLEGSPRAYLVKDPLPVAFSILPEETTRLIPEVLIVGDAPPSEFGYASFSFQVIKPLPFFIMVTLEDSLLMAPVVITDAILTVYSPDGWRHRFRLEAKINRVVIRGGSRYYILVIEKEGYEPRKLEVPAEKLRATTEENPLVIRLGHSQYRLLTLQPGPEAGIDAMFTDLEPDTNYGDHPYFEATYLSEPVLTVMRSTRSLIRFSPTGLPKSARIRKVILTLYYELPVPWDSIYNDSIYYDSLFYFQDPTTSNIAWTGAVLQQVVEPWREYGVTWNTQPKTIEANQVYISPFVRDANFIDVNVTRLFVPMMETAAPNYGMMLRLWPSEQFPGFRFASSDYADPAMRPRLRIYYTL